jgi:hypothetical protein
VTATGSRLQLLFCGWSEKRSVITEAIYWPIVPALDGDDDMVVEQTVEGMIKRSTR